MGVSKGHSILQKGLADPAGIQYNIWEKQLMVTKKGSAQGFGVTSLRGCKSKR